MNWLRGLFEADVSQAFRDAANKGDIGSLAKAMGKQYEQATIYNRMLTTMEESTRMQQERRAAELEARQQRAYEASLKERERDLEQREREFKRLNNHFSKFSVDSRSAVKLK